MAPKAFPVSCAGQNEPLEAEVVMDAYLKGIAYAHRKLAGFSNSALGAAIAPGDVTHTALVKVLNGERLWDQEKVPDFSVHLIWSIRGEIANTYRGANYQRVYRGAIFEEAVATEKDQTNSDGLSELEKAELKKLVQFILVYIKENRRDLLAVARFMYKEEAHKPKEIAEGLNMSVRKVNTAKYALKRILKGKTFLINFIANNHSHLEQMAIAILDEELERAREIACHLGITEAEARSQRDELLLILEDVRNVRRRTG